jgi:hypothetical protein
VRRRNMLQKHRGDAPINAVSRPSKDSRSGTSKSRSAPPKTASIFGGSFESIVVPAARPMC